MMISINLIPEERKSEIKRKKTFKVIIIQELLVLFAVVLFFSTVIGIHFVLGIERSVVEKTNEDSQKREDYKALKEYQQKFKEVNDVVLNVQALQSKHLHWSSVFSVISNIAGSGIEIKTFNTKEYSVTLTGKAKSRESLLSFQEQLESSKCFSGVDVPLSSLVTRENIDFQIELKVKRECIIDESPL